MATSSQPAEASATVATPWEQHEAPSIIPRFSYSAAADLLKRPHAGFLITCTMRREKSATKEAMELLREYMGRPLEIVQDTIDFSSTSEPNVSSTIGGANMSICHKCNRENTCTESGGFRTKSTHSKIDNGVMTSTLKDMDNDSNFYTFKEYSERKEVNVLTEQQGLQLSCEASNSLTIPEFSLVKLAKNGIIFLSILEGGSIDVVQVLNKILLDLDAGKLKPPKWCHRIVPVQATCLLSREKLYRSTLRLVKDYVTQMVITKESSLKFAVALNWRGADHTHGNTCQVNDAPCNQSLLKKSESINVVVEAVQEVALHATVNLTEPEMAVIVELLPVSGLHSNNLCAVTVLPGELMCSKPRLCVRSLSSQASHLRSMKRKIPC